ncbi:type IV toxin-antitoxin system AbiEi family antitoxin [Cellulomonas marina]|uniref:type IV toxin-antitoxin system AbiEi family antitoxin n=1 Tax=Cellulomonas marina TaxID=988821 RepID=UPI0011144317|nr:type IV toxin-antitoxin system AbiEi family antitoxin [Cellulomonas marina]GIG29154.1 hypothetical protein Cma02nite_17540 [Cellulomonas marina]
MPSSPGRPTGPAAPASCARRDGALSWADARRGLPGLVGPEHVGGRAALATLVRSGALVVVRDEVTAAPAVAHLPVVRARAVAHLVPPRGVVGRASAAWVHAGGPAAVPLEVLVPTGTARPRARAGVVGHEAELRPEDVVTVAGVPVTTPARTALDVARTCTAPAVHRLLSALARAGVDLGAVLARLGDRPGGRGVRQARAVLAAHLADGADR